MYICSIILHHYTSLSERDILNSFHFYYTNARKNRNTICFLYRSNKPTNKNELLISKKFNLNIHLI